MLQNMCLSFVILSYMHVHIYTSPMAGGRCRGLPEHSTAAVDTLLQVQTSCRALASASDAGGERKQPRGTQS